MKSVTDIATGGSETVVITYPNTCHHGREVICKAGTSEIAIDDLAGIRPCRFVRTDEKDELGRSIFKVAEAE